MSQPSAKLFVPDQAIYWLDANAKLGKPIDKREWLQTHNLPEFADSPKEDEKTPWKRIDGIQPRNEFLKSIGRNSDPTNRKLLCFTASAGVGKSIALGQIAYLRSLDPEHMVIRYHFSQLPRNEVHFWCVGDHQRRSIQSQFTYTLVQALLHTVFPAGNEDPGWPNLTGVYEQAVLLLIKSKIQKGQVTLIVDGLDEYNFLEEDSKDRRRSDRAAALRHVLYECKNLHCVVAGRPYSIIDEHWEVLFASKISNQHNNSGSDWEFCLSALFTEEQSKRYMGQRFEKLVSLQAQTPLTPRHLDVIRTLPDNRFANLHSLACVYWEMLKASLAEDVERKKNDEAKRPPKVLVKPEQYIGYLATLAYLTVEHSEDLLTLDLMEHEAELTDRIMEIKPWKYQSDSLDRRKDFIAQLNSSTIEFNQWRHGGGRVVWKDRTVMDFFAALWLVRYSTDEQQQRICSQVPRNGKEQFSENRRDLWTFIAGMPFDALEKVGDKDRDARWLNLVHRLFQPFDDAKRPTQLMYIAWEEIKRATKDQNRARVATAFIASFRKQYENLLEGSDESTIIHEDLEDKFMTIPPPEGGWFSAETTLANDEDNRRISVFRPYEVCAYPVTRRLYALFDLQQHRAFRHVIDEYSPNSRCPAIRVSWYDATMFAEWAGARLMKEEEWEYACRANIREDDPKFGLLSENFWENDPNRERLKEFAWIESNSQNRTWPVDAKVDGSHTNPFGLIDMLGNVWEWTDSLYTTASAYRVLRGGSFNDFGCYASTSYRHYDAPAFEFIDCGFRLARDLKRES